MKQPGLGINLISTLGYTCLMILALASRSSALHVVSSTTLRGNGVPICGNEVAHDITHDATGNLYVVGQLANVGCRLDLWVAKFNNDLALLSSTTISGEDVTWGYGITLDVAGDVWVTGSLESTSPSNSQIIVGRLSPDLVLRSSATFDSIVGSGISDAGWTIKARPGGGVYVGGTSGIIGDQSYHAKILALNPDLQVLASTVIPSASFIRGMTVDAGGDVWATGAAPGMDLWIGRFNSALSMVSSKTFDSGSSDNDAGRGIAISTDSSIWTIGITGKDAVPGSSDTIWLIKNSPSFETEINTFLSPLDQVRDYGADIAIDLEGNLWMVGSIASAFWSAAYNSNLTLKSSATFPAGQQYASPNALDATADGRIWVAGHGGPPSKALLARLAIEPELIVGLTTTSLTASALRWSWAAPVAFPADSYRLFQSSSGILLGTSTTTAFNYVGLATNTAYGLRVAGVNPSGQGELSASATVYTLAAPPGADAFTGVTETVLQTNWTSNDNPPGTAYTVLLSTGASPATNGYSDNLSSTTFNLAAVFSGLSPGQAYFAEVRAINGDGVPTAYTALGSTSTTGLAAPTGFAGTTLGISSITWSWGNVAAESGFRVVSSTDGNMSGNLPADTLAWTELDLATNTAYTRSAVAVAATDTSTSTSVTRWTLAMPPSGTTLDAVYNSSITVSWQANTNPAGTLYQVLVWKTGSSTATWEVTATSAALTGLNQASTYYLAVRAVNGDDVATQMDVALSTLTLDVPVQQSVDPGLGGTIVFLPPSGAVSVNIPPQAFQQAVNVTIQTPDTVPVGGTQSTPLTATGVSIELTLDQPVQPVRPVSITVSYRDSDIVGLDESRLILARYDTLRNVWVPLLSTVDSGSNRVVGRTDHFSLFQIMQASPAGDVQSPRIFPNPLRPAQGHTSMTFMNLPAYCRVRIYTVVGELVKELQTDAAGMAAWDGTNESGRKAASGVYYVLAQGNGQSNTFKVAIQR